MGQTLSEPVTQKETSRCENSWLRVGASCMQGWRVNMEDAHTTILSLPDDPGTAFFAVYDGHGGARIAQHAGKHLHKSIVNRPEYSAGQIEAAVKQGFLDLDNAMQTDEVLKDELAGTTAICCLLRNRTVYCGNVGDSRAIASVSGRVEELSSDHKPSLASEQRRITAAGGWVELNRVNGNLALSRALGDFVFKKNELKGPEEQIVTACPDVTVRELTDDWEFIVLACDGIWDVMTNQEVVNFVRLRLSQGMEPEDVCEDLMTRCLAPDCQMGGLGCDNMTVILICILQSGSWKEEDISSFEGSDIMIEGEHSRWEFASHQLRAPTVKPQLTHDRCLHILGSDAIESFPGLRYRPQDCVSTSSSESSESSTSDVCVCCGPGGSDSDLSPERKSCAHHNSDRSGSSPDHDNFIYDPWCFSSDSVSSDTPGSCFSLIEDGICTLNISQSDTKSSSNSSVTEHSLEINDDSISSEEEELQEKCGRPSLALTSQTNEDDSDLDLQ